MALALIYHATNPAFMGEPRAFPEDFTVVARIPACDDLEHAFQLTNHIDCEWWANPGVERVGPPCRSTSVGDVVVLDGIAHRVEGCGWSELGPVDSNLQEVK